MNRLENKKNHLRKKLAGKLPDKTICLAMIVKNESKNMIRLLDTAKPIIDFISIIDTGSTDNTVDIIVNWAKYHKVPCKMFYEAFTNFGYNRTQSVIKAKEAYPQADYFLLSDADFLWEVDVGSTFNKKLLFSHQYTVTQYTDSISYSNTRLLSSKVDWECVGVTHEYWKAKDDNTFKGEIQQSQLNTIKIKDLEDGGCKSDKFERDQRLLEKEYYENDTLEEGLKVRYSFYLAQTYKCLGLIEKSIEMYIERISYGYWYEEVYMSMYQIGINYETWKGQLIQLVSILEKKAAQDKVDKYIDEQDKLVNKKVVIGEKEEDKLVNKTNEVVIGEKEKVTNKLDDTTLKYIARWNPDNLSIDELKAFCVTRMEEAIRWYKKAWEYRPVRAESIAKMIVLLRDLSRHQEAYDFCHIGKKIPYTSDILFVEPEAYQDWFYDFELSIDCCYLAKKKEGADACIRLLERNDLKDHIRNRVELNCAFYN